MKSCDSALAYRARGFSVIPIEPRGKKPLIAWEQYQRDAATGDGIKRWWDKWPQANVGLVTGAVSRFIVIDIDTEAAKEKLKALVGEYNLDSVPRSRTGRGWQVFFTHPGGTIQNKAGVLPGLDVRGDGGYVVAPPSIHPTRKQYVWEVPLGEELPKLPVELFKLISSPQENEQGPRERFNTAAALNGVPEGKRDETVWKLACKLRSADVPHDMAFQLILEAARNCEPPFSEKIATEKVERAYRKFQPGQHAAKEPEFWPEFISAKDLLFLPPDPTRWVWRETLPFSGGSVLVAKPKIGKSTLAVNLSIAVGRGLPFLGRDTIQCPVAYLSLDASLPEIAETFTRFGLRETDSIFIHAGAAPREAIAWLVQRIREKGVRFVVVDTLQRLFRFQNLNDYSEVTNTLEPLLEAVREQNAHVCFLHHAKKDAGDDLDSAIGTTAIRGLAYTYLHLKRLPNSERRILRSDQRGGKNISEMAIGFGRTGWLEVQGTMEEVEIEETGPKILEILQAEDNGLPEKEIRKAIPLRGWIVGKALRELVRKGDLERIGDGKPRKPFIYHVSQSLLHGQSLSFSYSPEMGVIGGETLGLDTKKAGEVTGNAKRVSSPEHSGRGRDETGLDEKKQDLGTRLKEGWEEFEF